MSCCVATVCSPSYLNHIRSDVVIARQPNEPSNIIGKRITAVVSEFAAAWRHLRALLAFSPSFCCRLGRRLSAGMEPNFG